MRGTSCTHKVLRCIRRSVRLGKVSAVLDDSKLQEGGSSETAIEQGDFEGASESYFYLSDDRYMNFLESGDGNRCELRQIDQWITSASTAHGMAGDVKVFQPEDSSLDELTFMQIHDDTNADNAINKPLIRLVWLAERSDDSLTDYIYAIIRTSVDDDEYDYVPLIARPDGFFNAEISCQSNTMVVTIDGETKISRDVAYWEDLDSYYKAGVYLQNDGEGHVQFDTLDYY